MIRPLTTITLAATILTAAVAANAQIVSPPDLSPYYLKPCFSEACALQMGTVQTEEEEDEEDKVFPEDAIERMTHESEVRRARLRAYDEEHVEPDEYDSIEDIEYYFNIFETIQNVNHE